MGDEISRREWGQLTAAGLLGIISGCYEEPDFLGQKVDEGRKLELKLPGGSTPVWEGSIGTFFFTRLGTEHHSRCMVFKKRGEPGRIEVSPAMQHFDGNYLVYIDTTGSDGPDYFLDFDNKGMIADAYRTRDGGKRA